jgi:hypothetical protein
LDSRCGRDDAARMRIQINLKIIMEFTEKYAILAGAENVDGIMKFLQEHSDVGYEVFSQGDKIETLETVIPLIKKWSVVSIEVKMFSAGRVRIVVGSVTEKEDVPAFTIEQIVSFVFQMYQRFGFIWALSHTTAGPDEAPKKS